MVLGSGGSPSWYAPVPAESILDMRGSELVRERKTASAIGERQMLPKQMKRIDMGGADSVVAAVPFEASLPDCVGRFPMLPEAIFRYVSLSF